MVRRQRRTGARFSLIGNQRCVDFVNTEVIQRGQSLDSSPSRLSEAGRLRRRPFGILPRAREIAGRIAQLPPLTASYTRVALTQKLRRVVDESVGYCLALEGISAADVEPTRLVRVVYLWDHRGVLHPPTRPPRLRFRSVYEILRVGGMSSLVSASTNITLAITTGFVGHYGVSALAGYGAGVRLEFLLVSLSYAIGGPAGIPIGTSVGAHHNTRALRVAWIGTLVAGLTAETIGLAAA
jgi:hypothetical protein